MHIRKRTRIEGQQSLASRGGTVPEKTEEYEEYVPLMNINSYISYLLKPFYTKPTL
jgi:hypothetical protein